MKTQLTWNANRAWLGFFSGERHNALTACATRATQSIISRMCPLTLIYVCPRIMMKLACLYLAPDVAISAARYWAPITV